MDYVSAALTARSCRTVALLVATSVALRAGVVINEVHYDPADATSAEEFVELLNHSENGVEISGWSLTGGVEYTFPEAFILGPGDFVVVAQDPVALRARFGDVPVAGPFSGRLSNDGEDLILRDRRGVRIDVVDYRRGFPWPTIGGSGGYSMELIHPALDNELGASWRISNPVIGQTEELVGAASLWRYRKGTSEASAPIGGWREIAFNDGSWGTGRTPIGYGEGLVATSLDDMRGGYTSVFMRRTFEVKGAGEVGGLTLEVLYDDGFKAWINGTLVASDNVPSGELAYDATAGDALEDLSFNEFTPPAPDGYLVSGTNVLAVQLFNASLDGSSDAFCDARLTSSAGASRGPTPGARNSIFSETSPPQLRQVALLNDRPVSGEPVHVSVKATDADGVASVELGYQLVVPGSYIRLSDPAYETSWTSVAMRDDGLEGDLQAGDDVYSVLLAGDLQVHRHLVRYRITATDGTGLSVRVPYPDDPQPNFAYFVHDGIPGWRGASRPGATPVRDFPPEVMASLPVYYLVANESDVINSQYNSSSDGVHFLGTMGYEGDVYDHIEFENRGEFSTYVSGKNKWRFHFNRAHEFAARDDHGERYKTRWRTMNLSGLASPWVPTNRGMAGLDEGVAFKLYGVAGVPSPKTNFFYLHVIDAAIEAHPTNQYSGDLWGLYMTIEHTDGRFLDERDLPDGNTYKIESGQGDKRNQGPTQSTDSSDYNALRNGYNSSQPIAWWRSNVDLDVYYGFRAVNRAVNNMDLREGWNIAQYHNPVTGRWSVIPWDLDMLWMPVTHWSGVMNFQNALSQHAQLLIEYRNRCRELQDLLFTDDQLGQLVGELAAVVNPPGQPLTAVDVDEAMWNDHPRTASNHRGAFYRNPSTHGARGGTITRTLVSADHEGMVEWVKSFALEDYGAAQLEAHARDAAIPERPTATAIGAPSFPADDLRFRTSDFSDPQGAGTFAALNWRIAEVSPPGEPPFDPERPKRFEVNALWENGEVTPFTAEVQVPPEFVVAGRRYRVRVRMKDDTGRWSRWSEAVEFTAGAPTVPFPPLENLRITEVMYHPSGSDDLEFIELKNVGAVTLDLSGVALSDGVEFEFAEGEITELPPGELLVVVRQRTAFEAVYGPGLPVAGEYRKNLANDGERVVLSWGTGWTILDCTYSDLWYPQTDGAGYSLVIADELAPAESWNVPASWIPSRDVGGSPGLDEGGPPPGGWQLAGDSNQDGTLEISDAVSLLRRILPGSGLAAPCDGPLLEGGNLVLLDANDDARLDLADVLYTLNHLFLDGPAPVGGASCARIEGCPTVCRF